MNSFYSKEEVLSIGFKSVGEDVRISRKCSIYSPEKMIIGDHVRVDDFSILSGAIRLGSYIHLSAGCMLFGGNDGIVIEDFVGVSSRCALYAESDDYSGCCMTNPMVPEEFRHIIHGGIRLKKHSIIGSGCTVLPGVIIGEGCAVGAMSLINKSLDDWWIYIGVPCRRLRERSQDIIRIEQLFVRQS